MNALLSATLGDAVPDTDSPSNDNTLPNYVVQKLNFDEESQEDDDLVACDNEKSNGQQIAQDFDNALSSAHANEDMQLPESEESQVQSILMVDASNMGVLSDFSDRTSNSTPVATELLGQMDEIQACMISISDMEPKSSDSKTSSLKTDISNSEDLSLILKRIVELCHPTDRRHLEAQCMNQVCAVWCMHDLGPHRCQDILNASLRGLSCYIDTASDSTALANQIQSELRVWFSSIIRLPDYTSYIYTTPVEAVVSLTEYLLFSNYPNMAEDGLFALYSKYPVIYMSSDDAAIYSSQILSRLYLPRSVISVVPYNFTTPNSRTLDIKAFQRLITDDVACGKLPLLVLTTVGTGITGHIDNIPAIKHLCDTHGIWLHAKGSCCPLLALSSPPPTVKVLHECDSVTVSCDTLLCDTTTDTAVLYINSESDHVTSTAKLEVMLPLWVMLQQQGETKIRSKIQDSYNLAVQLYNELKSIDNIQLLEYPLTGHVVCFRYYSLLDDIPDISEQEPMNSLMSQLTRIMCESLEHSLGSDRIQLVEFSGHISVIRLSPLDNSSLSLEDIPLLLSSVQSHVTKFESSLRLRGEFNKEIQSRENFLLLLDPLHPSVGAFQYLPKYLQDEEACNTVEGCEELNEINEKMCDYLGSGRWEIITTRPVANFTVISIPLVSEHVDIKALLDDIVSTAPKFENNSKYLARMSDIIRKGIDRANEELLVESEQQFYEKGIIRQIPLFGPVFNWMSPIEEKKIVGRTFSLHSGKIEPTDTVYSSKVGTPTRSRTVSSSSIS